MDFPSLGPIRKAYQAGFVAEAARLARELAPALDTPEMLALADLMHEHLALSGLVEAWRKRRTILGLEDRELQPWANALNALAVEHTREGRSDEALPLFHLALESAPELRYVRRNLASTLLDKGEFQQAMIELDYLLAADTSDADSHLLAGIAQYQVGDPQAALESLEFAAAAGMPDAQLMLLKAQCLLDRGEEATRTLKTLLQEHSERGPAMLGAELSDPGSPLHRLQDWPGANDLLSGIA